jgi:hypothetical protein
MQTKVKDIHNDIKFNFQIKSASLLLYRVCFRNTDSEMEIPQRGCCLDHFSMAKVLHASHPL